MIKETLKQMWSDCPMGLKYSMFFISGMILASCCINVGCSYLKHYPQDNIIEEIAEDVLQHETGIDIDFTPYSPEKGNNTINFFK